MAVQRVKAVLLLTGAEDGRIAAKEARPRRLAEVSAGNAAAFRGQNVKVKKASQRVIFLKKKHGPLEVTRRSPHAHKGLGAGGGRMAPLREDGPSVPGYALLHGHYPFPKNAAGGQIVP